MSRYIFSGEHRSNLGKRVVNTTIYPNLPPSSHDLYIISREGDRLDILANKYYKDVSKWWIIAVSNSLGKGTMEIDSGMQLRIPMNIGDFVRALEDAQKG